MCMPKCKALCKAQVEKVGLCAKAMRTDSISIGADISTNDISASGGIATNARMRTDKRFCDIKAKASLTSLDIQKAGGEVLPAGGCNARTFCYCRVTSPVFKSVKRTSMSRSNAYLVSVSSVFRRSAGMEVRCCIFLRGRKSKSY